LQQSSGIKQNRRSSLSNPQTRRASAPESILASERGQADIVRLLLGDPRVHVNSKPTLDPRTAFQRAVESGQLLVVHLPSQHVRFAENAKDKSAEVPFVQYVVNEELKENEKAKDSRADEVANGLNSVQESNGEAGIIADLPSQITTVEVAEELEHLFPIPKEAPVSKTMVAISQSFGSRTTRLRFTRTKSSAKAGSGPFTAAF
jgi:hypothetical protein